LQDHHTPNSPNKHLESEADKPSVGVSPENHVVATLRSLVPHPVRGEFIRLGAAYPDPSKRDPNKRFVQLFNGVSLAGLPEFLATHFAATIVSGCATYHKGADARPQFIGCTPCSWQSIAKTPKRQPPPASALKPFRFGHIVRPE
jgi:hypothetical protein